MDKLHDQLANILRKYSSSFGAKIYEDENNDHDILMDVFGITPELKRENRQYWGRELGMCWQLLVSKVAAHNCADYKPAFKVEKDEPIDLFIGNDAIDTKYRIGSGDSGTLKKFRTYGKLLTEQGYNPTLLILREDNLSAALGACLSGGWKLYIGEDSLRYIKLQTNFDLKFYLQSMKGQFQIGN
jgi:hypothetical protein